MSIDLQVREGLEVHALVDLDLVEVHVVTRPIGMPRGNSDSPFAILKPEVATVFSVTRPPSTNSMSRSRGLPTFGRTTPVAPEGITWPPRRSRRR